MKLAVRIGIYFLVIVAFLYAGFTYLKVNDPNYDLTRLEAEKAERELNRPQSAAATSDISSWKDEPGVERNTWNLTVSAFFALLLWETFRQKSTLKQMVFSNSLRFPLLKYVGLLLVLLVLYSSGLSINRAAKGLDRPVHYSDSYSNGSRYSSSKTFDAWSFGWIILLKECLTMLVAARLAMFALSPADEQVHLINEAKKDLEAQKLTSSTFEWDKIEVAKDPNLSSAVEALMEEEKNVRELLQRALLILTAIFCVGGLSLFYINMTNPPASFDIFKNLHHLSVGSLPVAISLFGILYRYHRLRCPRCARPLGYPRDLPYCPKCNLVISSERWSRYADMTEAQKKQADAFMMSTGMTSVFVALKTADWSKVISTAVMTLHLLSALVFLLILFKELTPLSGILFLISIQIVKKGLSYFN